MQLFPKEPTPNFSDQAQQLSFVNSAHDSKTLLQKELSVNQAEQVLLKQRIDLMRTFINDLPSSDPEYSMMLTQVQMDTIELDELKARASLLSHKLLQ